MYNIHTYIQVFVRSERKYFEYYRQNAKFSSKLYHLARAFHRRFRRRVSQGGKATNKFPLAY